MRRSVLVGVAFAACVLPLACKGRFALPADARFVKEIAVSDSFACARMKDGSVRCWGSNESGQLGDGTVSSRRETARVALDAVAAKVATGAHHACSITSNGDVYCWGANDAGQVTGTPGSLQLVPAKVVGVHARALGLGGRHSCALSDDGAVRCWGANEAGKGAVAEHGATAIAAYADRTCVIDGERRVSCWGLGGGALGTLGRVEGMADVTSLALGPAHACAVRAWGGAACWGTGAEGELGDGTLADRPMPAEVLGLAAPAKAVVVGRAHSCAALTDGTVRCWGANAASQLADGTKTARATAAQIQGVFEAVQIAAGGDTTCAVLADGSARCWGGLALPKTDVVPVVVPTEVRW